MRSRLNTLGLLMTGGVLLSGVGVQAITRDLSAGGSGTINSSFFSTSDNQSTGTGVIDPFVRLQANGTEDGYNASLGNGLLMSAVKSGTWTHDIQLNQIPVVVNPTGAPTGSYYEFLLDINQNTGAPGLNDELISLDKLQLYTRSTALSDATINPPPGATLRYDLDVGPDGDSYLKLNYSLNAGSGSGDLFAYVPTSAFAGASATDYLYFYSRFGDHNETNDGFEEWAVRRGTTPPPPVPDSGSTMTLLGIAMVGVECIRRKLKK